MKSIVAFVKLVLVNFISPAIVVGGLAAPSYAQVQQLHLVRGEDVVEVQMITPNIVCIHMEPNGRSTPRTPVVDPSLQPMTQDFVRVGNAGSVQTLSSREMKVVVDNETQFSVEVQGPKGQALVTLKTAPTRGPIGAGRPAPSVGLVIEHDQNEELYGIHGLDLSDNGSGLLRTSGGQVAAGVQGGGGGPFFFTKQYGVLVDSDGGSFQTHDETIRLEEGSRPDAEYFVIVGAPMKSLSGLALLTGKPPMPPKWTLGFINSQWGGDEDEWRQLTKTYEQKDIPVSGYIFDFDWKAWGEDDYGEWRWNSTSGAGNAQPDKFPDGSSGKFATDMLEHGIHLGGILKPRILVTRVDGKPTTASQYATDHNLWYPDEVREDDYFTRRPAANIDFNNPEARKWYWEHLEPAFHAGMTAWWNDEADKSSKMTFNNFQFMNMARTLFEGQRSISSERVWSINRAYYLGAARFGYAEWSGDIDTGFQSMAYQRRRMLSTLDLGESAWSMDSGGFHGHPSPENYARWIEFGAFVPIFRVHGGSNEKRQPWVYGPVAEAAARKAMRLRYDLMPYIYSNARLATETGIGIVRPLFWIFPEDPKCADESRAWMFGDALLVSPIVEHGLRVHSFYLPEGDWLEYDTGKHVSGRRDIAVSSQDATWQNIPIYVREGSILATQPTERGNEVSPNVPLVLDVFPSPTRVGSFIAYDDDGHTYGYEKGEYFRQEITVQQGGRGTDIVANAPSGTYEAHFPDYLLRVHQGSSMTSNGGVRMKKFATEDAFRASAEAGWFSSVDRFGPLTQIRIPHAKGTQFKLTLSRR